MMPSKKNDDVTDILCRHEEENGSHRTGT